MIFICISSIYLVIDISACEFNSCVIAIFNNIVIINIIKIVYREKI